jgi:hypothetical protein
VFHSNASLIIAAIYAADIDEISSSQKHPQLRKWHLHKIFQIADAPELSEKSDWSGRYGGNTPADKGETSW